MDALILPPQNVRPLDDTEAFQNTWYLFLQTLRDYAAIGSKMVSYGTHAQRLAFDTQNLPDAALYYETDTNTLFQWRKTPSIGWYQIGAPGGTGGGVVTQIVNVAGAPLTITPIAFGSNNFILYVIVTQDATGYPITWDSAYFKFAPAVPVDPFSQSVVTFYGNSADGLWYNSGASLLGARRP